MDRDIVNISITNRLKNAGIENYIFEAKIIEEHIRKNMLDSVDREDIIRRRVSREPLQYILGEWEFYGDVYKLNRDCLIPRPETEFLTEYIIKNAERNSIIIDLCSGSGCVSVSALKRRKDLSAVLIDIALGAVEISKENAALNGVSDRVKSYCLDIKEDFGEIINFIRPRLNKIGMIVSNPPYLTKSDMDMIKAERTELWHEPDIAFYGGDDGLDFYRFIINNYSKPFNLKTAVEAGIDQAKDIVKMFEEIGFSCSIIRDYYKIERVIAGEKKY